MCGKRVFVLGLSVTVTCFAILMSLIAPIPAYARPAMVYVDNGNCIKCHEDLYFLHDTGNYFCIRESPMGCVDCHGGNPNAVTQETAHYDRSAHPVINGDISKCQECHTNKGECCECVSKFDQVAGINEVKRISPVPAFRLPAQTTGLPTFEQQQSGNWFLNLAILPLFVTGGLALLVYLLYKVRHS